MRYRAYITIGDRTVLVLPRSKKTTLWPSVAAAERELNRRSRRLDNDGRGIIKDIDGLIVYTMAL